MHPSTVDFPGGYLKVSKPFHHRPMHLKKELLQWWRHFLTPLPNLAFSEEFRTLSPELRKIGNLTLDQHLRI